MKILFAGDIKGNFIKAHEIISDLQTSDIDFTFQTGDVGFFMDNQLSLEKAAQRLRQKPEERNLVKKQHRQDFPRYRKKVLAITGDFDDYSALHTYKLLSSNFVYLPKTGFYPMGDTNMLILGGIYSKKRFYSSPRTHKDKRFITEKEFDKCLKSPENSSILLAHEGPYGIGPVKREGSVLVSNLIEKFSPEFVIHGHHHKNYVFKHGSSTIIGLGNLNQDANSYKILEL